ncbi:MAG: hypothetical protein DRI69_07985, partial [Bacteroidetes bacterium]
MKLSQYISLSIILILGYGCTSNAPVTKKLTQQQRVEHMLELEFWRTYDPALGYVPRERLRVAVLQTRAMQQAMIERRAPDDLIPKFNERGPNDIGGRTRAIFVDMRDADGKKVWVGSVSGGLYVTEDITVGRPDWKNVDDYLENLSVSSIVQDFDDHNIMYMGTGEGYGGGIARGVGIFKSVDGGVTWELLSSTENSAFRFTRSMAIQPETGFVYAATGTGGVLQSKDGG